MVKGLGILSPIFRTGRCNIRTSTSLALWVTVRMYPAVHIVRLSFQVEDKGVLMTGFGVGVCECAMYGTTMKRDVQMKWLYTNNVTRRVYDRNMQRLLVRWHAYPYRMY